MSLQAAYSDRQIGAFENFHQPVENTLMVLWPGPKVVLQYELRFVNRLRSQLLIGHLFLPIKQMPRREEEARNQADFGNTPTFLSYSINFYFNARSPQRIIAAASWFNTASEVDGPDTLGSSSNTVCLFGCSGKNRCDILQIHPAAWLP